MTPEGFEKKKIRDHLKKREACWFFSPYMAGFGQAGVPDIVGCWRGKFFCVEVKRPGKEPTPIQWRRMNEVEAAGGKAFWGTAERIIPLFEEWAR